MVIEPISELETGSIALTSLVDSKDYRDMYVYAKVHGGPLPDFMDMRNDKLTYAPRKGDYGIYDIVIVYEKDTTDLEPGYKVEASGTLFIE